MATNFRNPLINEPRIFGGSTPMYTPAGTVMTHQSQPPALPPRVYSQQQSGYGNIGNYGGMGNYGNNYGMGLGGYGSGYGGGYGTGYGGGFGSYGSYGGMMGGGYNRFGGGYGNENPNDPENRFIQLAEQSSRPAFQSIESLVGAIGNIAAMLESTLFAITSSFRAILGVAANFGRLRTLFGQFWSTFAIFRGLNWLYRKLLFTLKVSNIDPKSVIFNEAFSAASNSVLPQGGKNSPLPIFLFLSFIFTAPYLIMKLLNSVTTTASEETKDPKKWIRPIKAQAVYNFQSTNPDELTIRAGQILLIAPKEIQTQHKLINTGWALATTDNQISGLIPINYVQEPHKIPNNIKKHQPESDNIQSLPIQPSAIPDINSEILKEETKPIMLDKIEEVDEKLIL